MKDWASSMGLRVATDLGIRVSSAELLIIVVSDRRPRVRWLARAAAIAGFAIGVGLAVLALAWADLMFKLEETLGGGFGALQFITVSGAGVVGGVLAWELAFRRLLLSELRELIPERGGLARICAHCLYQLTGPVDPNSLLLCPECGQRTVWPED